VKLERDNSRDRPGLSAPGRCRPRAESARSPLRVGMPARITPAARDARPYHAGGAYCLISTPWPSRSSM
jgi:hypothetical protein